MYVLRYRNIDQSQLRPVPRGDWRLDEQVGDFQLDNSYYRHNVWDRGHLAPRSAAAWGSTDSAAKAGSDATMIYSNVALQHSNFNGDEWLALYVLLKSDSIYRSCKRA